MARPRPLRLPRRSDAGCGVDSRRVRPELAIDVGTALAILAVIAAAAGQAITAIGFSLVAMPFVSLVVGPATAVPTINLLAGGLNVVMLAAERRSAQWRDALLLLVPAALVIPFVGRGIERLDADTLSLINGAVILLATALLATGLRARSLRGRRGALLAGATSGAMNVATSVGGPPVAMYAVNADWPVASYRPTIQAYFLGINILSVATRGFPDLGDAALLPAFGVAMIAGWLAGRGLARRIDDALVRRLLLAIAALGGATALLRGLL